MSGAHIAAAEARKRRQQEEERLTRYNRDDLNEGWEFKIVRSITSAFEKPDVFYRVLEEEALSGWDLLEKLDDGRLRFKRPTSQRKRDAMLPEGINPYRTRVGMSEGALAVTIIATILTFLIPLIIVINMVESGRLTF